MKSLKMLILAPAIMLSAACSKDKPADPSLNSDLGLAAQANTPLDSVTAAEQSKGATGTSAMRSGTTAAAAPKATSSSTTHKASSTASHSSGTSTASSGTTTKASTPVTTVQKNTKRDAAIGAGAGAVIGAVTSKNKVKGAVIGGAAGAILGGVIGNNVDVKKTTKP
jgi:outer membrane lipoprotein SlyB